MRIHVYEEELGVPVEVSVVRQTATTGVAFMGLRLWLEGPDALHNSPEDDDRSAVTVWATDSEEGWILLEDLCHRLMLALTEERDRGRG